ncbi:MAG: GIY-YIG nuclease family protein [Bauldia sp.]|nr:GIY-YIG nuclease family protein [Bauldia sp.]
MTPDKDARKAAIAAYKERKAPAGVFALRCAASGEAWVGQARDLATIRNRIWFALDHGSHPVKGLQATWNAHGREALAFEELERIDPDLPDYARETALRERAAAWRAELGAATV